MEYRFPSDHAKAATPNLGELVEKSKFPEAIAGFLAPSYPYYEGGFRIVAECPEMRLIQHRNPDGPIEVELSNDLIRLYFKSAMGFNDSASSTLWQERLGIGAALHGLSRFTEANLAPLRAIKRPDRLTPDEINGAAANSVPTAVALGATIGLAIQALHSSDDPEQGVRELVAAFESGLRGWARYHGLLKDGRRRDRPRPNDLIEMAMVAFQIAQARPSKREVRKLVEKVSELTLRGKNASSKWTDLFNSAGLSDLPD